MIASRFLFSLAVSLMAVTGLQAAGAGVGAGIGVGSVGGAASSGGHGAAVSTGGAHVSAAPVGRASISSPGAAIGSRSLGGGNLRPMTANSLGAPRYLPGGFTPNVFPHSVAANTAASRAATVSAFGQTGTVPARTAPTAPAARAHNAWTDTTSTTNARNTAQNRFSGTTLFPDANHDAFGNPYPSGRGGNGASRGQGYPFRFRNRGYYNPYLYGYPGVLIGGYSPYYYGDTAGIADAASDYAASSIPDTVGESNALSPEAQNELTRPYASSQVTLPAGDSTVNSPDTSAAPNVPADQSVQPGNGPDSLVEAVQAELSRRGYFGGKIDAIYNPATHAAIQRFQTDQHLPASGRLNEATLHALELD